MLYFRWSNYFQNEDHQTMKNTIFLFALALFFIYGCTPTGQEIQEAASASVDYLDYSDRDDQFTGGIKMIPISTPKGTFKVWTKRTGNNPDMRVLLLHGGPGGTHEIYEPFNGYLPKERIEYIFL